MKLTVARHGGACYGVRRAITLAEEAIGSSPKPVRCLGPLIHNPLEVARLARLGLEVAGDLTMANAGTILVRSHGVPESVWSELKSRNVEVVDATCPFVEKVQQIARDLSREGYLVVVVGEPDHPEVEGIVSYIGGPKLVVQDPGEVADFPPGTKVGVVAQTTQSRGLLDAVVERIRRTASEVVVHDTLCGTTRRRQEEVLARAPEADLVIVVGGRESANTRRLVTLARGVGVTTEQVESEDDLLPEWFAGKESIFLTAGASTPRWVIDRTINRIRRLVPEIQYEGGTPSHE